MSPGALAATAENAAESEIAFMKQLDSGLPLRGDRCRVLFIDQLEDLSVPEDDAKLRARRQRFIEFRTAYVNSDKRNLLIETVRSDVDDKDLVGPGERLRVDPPELSRDQVKLLIKQPVERAGFDVQDELVNHLYRDLREWGSDDWLSILGIAMAEVVHRWQGEPQETKLTVKLYESIGGVAGVMQKLASSIEDRDGLPSVFSLLVRWHHGNSVPKRSIVSRDAVRGEERRALEELKRLRLVRDESGLQLSHDSLLDKWELLKRWISENRKDLAVLSDLKHTAAVWSAGQKALSELLVRDKIDAAEKVLKTFGVVERTYPLLREYVESSRSQRDQEALVYGILKGDFKSLIELLKGNVRLPEAMIKDLPYPAMYYAMLPQEVSTVPDNLGSADAGKSKFVFSSADVKGIALSGFRVQHFAAVGGRVDVLETLEPHGLDLQALTVKGTSPFDIAAYADTLNVLQYIWDRSPGRHDDLLRGHYEEGMTPLHWAAQQDHPRVIEWLLEHGADPNARTNNDKIPPLHLAVLHGGPEGVGELLRSSAIEPNAKDVNGLTALHLAASQGSLETVDLLIRDERVNADATDDRGMTALHYAVIRGRGDVPIVERILAKSGAVVNAAMPDGRTALHLAASQGPLETVDLLIRDERVNADPTDDRGMTALHYAVIRGDIPIFERIVAKSGAVVNAARRDGATALHLAAHKNALGIVDPLLSEPGIDREPRDKYKQLPIEVTTSPEVLARFVAAGSPPPLWSALIDTTGGPPKLRRLDGAELREQIKSELRPDPATLEWPLPQLLAGAWEFLAPEAAIEVLARAAMALPAYFGATFTAIDAVRCLPLPFYSGVTLYEARVLRGDTPVGLLTILEHGSDIVLLKGMSPPIHALNAKGLLQLDKPELMVDYLRFFCAAVHGEEGPFTLIETFDALVFSDDLPLGERQRVEALARPCEVIRAGQSGGNQFSAVIQYGAALFDAQFEVDPKGTVAMLDDSPLVTNLPLDTEHFVEGVRKRRPATRTDDGIQWRDAR
jgi:ankyrin repeat protein